MTPTWLAPVVTIAHALAVLGLVAYMTATGKMPVDTGVGIMTGQLGLYGGAAGAKVLTGKSAVAATPISGNPGAVVPAASPSSPSTTYPPGRVPPDAAT